MKFKNLTLYGTNVTPTLEVCMVNVMVIIYGRKLKSTGWAFSSGTMLMKMHR